MTRIQRWLLAAGTLLILLAVSIEDAEELAAAQERAWERKWGAR